MTPAKARPDQIPAGKPSVPPKATPESAAVAPTPEESGADPAPAVGEESEQDATRRRFREALERKNATAGGHPGSSATGDSTMKSSNGKRQRQFRRKSG